MPDGEFVPTWRSVDVEGKKKGPVKAASDALLAAYRTKTGRDPDIMGGYPTFVEGMRAECWLLFICCFGQFTHLALDCSVMAIARIPTSFAHVLTVWAGLSFACVVLPSG